MPKRGRSTLQDRLHRIQGQLNGVEKMLDTDEDMGKVMIQMQAVISGLESMKLEVVRKQIAATVSKQVEGALQLLK
jgi:CsoR family transcriptional regulator, copper-sensing transcriptional repressor